MISNTKTAEWALHIAVLQSIVADLYAEHVREMPAADVKALNERITARSKAAATEMALFLGKQPDPKANVFAKELLDTSDRVIAETLAEMQAPPG
jgi:hypothetical protein